jgi:crossover junction endodeoxyribonuclease RuvC
MKHFRPHSKAPGSVGTPRIIIGLDPGSLNFGYGIVDFEGNDPRVVDYGVVRLAGRGDFASRLFEIEKQLEIVFAAHSPTMVSVEEIFHHKNVKSAITLSHARAVGILAAVRSGAVLRQYSPRKIKLSVTGSGGADKKQVRRMVCRILKISNEKLALDASDALAAALCACYDRVSPAGNAAPAGVAGRRRWDLDAIRRRGIRIVGGT